MDESKICKKCGRILPIEKFRLKKSTKFYNPYYSGHCRECEGEYYKAYCAKKRNKEYTFSDDLKVLIERKFKEIKKERILDLSTIEMDLVLLGTDEIFVKLMEYKDTWLSNYGRAIAKTRGQYNLMRGRYVNGELRYTFRKNVFIDGKWTYKGTYVYAPKMVIETFIVNEDKANNNFIWHSGHDKADCYYRNLYPLNQEQFRIVSNHFNETGDDSEEFILKVMNDIRYKPDNWSMKAMKPTMCQRGYHGILYTNSKTESYIRWHDMMSRCYAPSVHKRQPDYIECSVCEEWLNYSNFKLWYDKAVIPWKILGESFDIDKDILFKGNKTYSPDTVCLVPHAINTLFLNARTGRGDYPLGVYYDKDKGKFRACMAFMGKSIKLGIFDTVESAFARYKEYKEDFIKDMAEQYKEKIPDRVYQAMMNWVVEIDD